MDRVVYVVGHRNPDTDSVCSAIAYAHLRNSLGERNVRPARAGDLDVETAFVLRRFGVPTPELLADADGRDLVLVDHNEVGQALPHIERANVLEVWEHHRVGDLRFPTPIVFHCQPVGATATLIAQLYVSYGVEPPRAMAGMMLASILSDTVVFRSPTTTEEDRVVAANLATIAEVDAIALGEEMLRVKTAEVETKTAAQIVRDDLKEFDLDGVRVGVAQVEVTRPDAFAGRKAEILREMRAACSEGRLVLLVLMITDVRAGESELLFVGDRREIFERAFGRLAGDAVRVSGCMSRKKQVIPALESAIERAKGTLSSEASERR